MIPAILPEVGESPTGVAEGGLGFEARNPPTAPAATMTKPSATKA
jgi:hypothetical protein